jgi:hypothetical protein
MLSIALFDTVRKLKGKPVGPFTHHCCQISDNHHVRSILRVEVYYNCRRRPIKAGDLFWLRACASCDHAATPAGQNAARINGPLLRLGAQHYATLMTGMAGADGCQGCQG